MKAKEVMKKTVKKAAAARTASASRKQPSEKARKVHKTAKSAVSKSNTIEVVSPIANELSIDFKNRLFKLDSKCQDSRTYENLIRDLNCGAKIKRVLLSLVKASKEVGGKIVRIGKIAFDFSLKILDKVLHQFPNLSTAIILALILQGLVYMIPFIGFILGPLLQPLILVAMVSVGVAMDVFATIRPLAIKHFCA